MGNRQRPHHGGTHARRVHGTTTCHYTPPQRPFCPVHLPGVGPLRLLIPQVVAPLPRVGCRWSLRSDPCHATRRPAHHVRTGEGHSLHPPPAPGPGLAGNPLPPHRGLGHLGWTQGLRSPVPTENAILAARSDESAIRTIKRALEHAPSSLCPSQGQSNVLRSTRKMPCSRLVRAQRTGRP